jgi:hypothetical protein
MKQLSSAGNRGGECGDRQVFPDFWGSGIKFKFLRISFPFAGKFWTMGRVHCHSGIRTPMSRICWRGELDLTLA